MRQAATDLISSAVVACAIVANTAGLIVTGIIRLTARLLTWLIGRLIGPVNIRSVRLARRTSHRHWSRPTGSAVATTGAVATIGPSGIPVGSSAPAYEQSSHTHAA